MLDPSLDTAHQLLDRLWLISCGLKFGDECKGVHDLELYWFERWGSMQILTPLGEGKHQDEGWSSDITSKAIGLLFRNSC
jgi:hypothetical protein